VPTVVPPVEHVVGADAWGPNTLKVSVPPAAPGAPASVELIELAGIAVPAFAAAGADALFVVVAFPTGVDPIALPQALVEPTLLASPL
jgi:hypothetical protein